MIHETRTAVMVILTAGLVAAGCGSNGSTSPKSTPPVTISRIEVASAVSEAEVALKTGLATYDECKSDEYNMDHGCVVYTNYYNTLFGVVDPITKVSLPAPDRVPENMRGVVTRTRDVASSINASWSALNDCQDGVRSSGGNAGDVLSKCETQLGVLDAQVEDVRGLIGAWAPYL